MSKFTDQNVPLKCAECDAYLEGFGETLQHIIKDHSDIYSEIDAHQYAEDWIEQAHNDQDEQLAEYYKDRKMMGGL